MSFGQQIAAATMSLFCCLIASLGATSPAQAHHSHRIAHPQHRVSHRAASRQSFRSAGRTFRRHHLPVETSGGIAAMVVDANSGSTLYAVNENELRHPASVTKVMTLYLMFEQMHRGRFNLASPIAISGHAASQPPTKLGLRPGSVIALEDAIKAMVTESANDIAVAVAEAVGGSEGNFAAMMTRKAHALGMSRTVYVNASGLPDDRQLTTAHDLIILGRAIQERFPAEYAFFSTRNFAYAGRNHRNHNHLLDQIDGIDGIKTGYTRASGFNLLASVHRGSRHLVSVVIGGKSPSSRDRIMTSLIEEHMGQASVDGHTAPMIAENDTPETIQPAVAAQAQTATPDAAPVAPQLLAANEQGAQSVAAAQTQAAQSNPTLQAASSGVADQSQAAARAFGDQTASIHPQRSQDTAESTEESALTSASASGPGAVHWAAGPSRGAHAAERRKFQAEKREVADRRNRAEATQTARNDAAKHTQIARAVDRGERRQHPGWSIQIGATNDLAKANELLVRARSRVSDNARPFAEKVRKGAHTLYRARFAGLEPLQAEAACRALKRQGIPCITVRN